MIIEIETLAQNVLDGEFPHLVYDDEYKRIVWVKPEGVRNTVYPHVPERTYKTTIDYVIGSIMMIDAMGSLSYVFNTPLTLAEPEPKEKKKKVKELEKKKPRRASSSRKEWALKKMQEKKK